MKLHHKADLMMFLVALCWGSSYLFMKMGLNTIQEFNLIALRFGIAFFLAALIFYKRLIKADLNLIKSAFVLGLILFSAFAFIIFGLKHTLTSNAGFLVGLRVVFIPLLTTVLLRRHLETKVLWGVCLAVIGIGLLTLNSDLAINSGDLLCIIGAVLFATHIIMTGKLAKNNDTIILGIFQLGFAGGLGLVFSIATEIPKLPNTFESWVSVLALSILCSAIGFIVQTAAQKLTTPTHTGLILSLEPVFAAGFAFLFAGETLTSRGYIGAVIVLFGVLSTEVDFRNLIFRTSGWLSSFMPWENNNKTIED